MTPRNPVATLTPACPGCRRPLAKREGLAWRRRFCSPVCKRLVEMEIRRLRRRLRRFQAEVDRLRPCAGGSLYREIRDPQGRSIHDLIRPYEDAIRALKTRIQTLAESPPPTAPSKETA